MASVTSLASLLTLSILLSGGQLFAQKNNILLIKPIVRNTQGEILLYHNTYYKVYEPAGWVYNLNIPISQFVDSVLRVDFNIQPDLKTLRLSGVYTRHDSSRTAVMMYYAVEFERYVNPAITIESMNGRWCNRSQAFELISYPSVKTILNHYYRRSRRVWSGGFVETNYERPEALVFKIVEPFTQR